ncbi:aquaporin-like protein [Clavulina sp. PMI_390]|nr:aquaporin-like protein [Clavulina sp. PMI_390]
MPRPLLKFHHPKSRGLDEDDGAFQLVTKDDVEAGRPVHAVAPTPKRHHAVLDTAAMLAEFVGTFMFLWLSFTGAQSASYNRGGTGGPNQGVTTTDNQTILFIALSFGMSLIVVAWVFFRISGAAFNPAVSLALWLVGSLTGTRAILITIAQLLGGIAAAAVTKGVTLSNFSVTNTTVGGLGNGQGLAIEMFTTAMLVFTVLMMAAEKHRGTFLAPVCIGLALFVGHLASVGWTGAGMNPARTFGPSVVNGFFPHNAWIWYIGQGLGAILATLVYITLKHIDYQEIVPGVDMPAAELSPTLERAPIVGLVPIRSITGEMHSMGLTRGEAGK